jgi:hypothetical protein
MEITQLQITKVIGRPTRYTNKLAVELCEQIANGSSLRKICDQSDFPDMRTVRRWLRDNEGFRLQYMRARDDQADYYADMIRDIALDVTPTRDEIEKAKLISNNLMWIASKLKPKKYGDKLDLTSAGERIEKPIYGGLSLGIPKQPIEGEVVLAKKPKRIVS